MKEPLGKLAWHWSEHSAWPKNDRRDFRLRAEVRTSE
jgi:hypothetical protein